MKMYDSITEVNKSISKAFPVKKKLFNISVCLTAANEKL